MLMIDKTMGSRGQWLLQNDYQNRMTDATGMSTPEWMVCIGSEGFPNASTVKGSAGGDYTAYIELLKWEARSSRDKRGLTASHALSTATLKHSPVEIHVPIGNYMPSLEIMMYTAANIETITIVRLVNIAGDETAGTPQQETQNIEFKNCQITFMEQSGDVLILAFQFTAKTTIVTSYDQLGDKIGAEVSATVDFTTAEAI